MSERTEDIVRALAAQDAPIDHGFADEASCAFCGADANADASLHAPDCPWRLAREWIAAAASREISETAISPTPDGAAALARAAEEMLREGHDGPCVNYIGQDPREYSDFDSCEAHYVAAHNRRIRLQRALDTYRDTQAAEDIVRALEGLVRQTRPHRH